MDYNNTDIGVRPAVASDVIDLLALVQEFCKEQNIDYDNKGIKNYIDAQLGKIPVFVAVYEGSVVGVISFLVMPSPFNPKKIISKKIAFFVDKNFRQTGIGKELQLKAEEQSKALGAVEFYISGVKQPEGYTVHETEYFKGL